MDQRQLKATRIDDFTSVLTIPSLKRAHEGVYACRAENSAGRAEHAQAVTVNGSRRVHLV